MSRVANGFSGKAIPAKVVARVIELHFRYRLETKVIAERLGLSTSRIYQIIKDHKEQTHAEIKDARTA